jgi:HEAT repeat protein
MLHRCQRIAVAVLSLVTLGLPAGRADSPPAARLEQMWADLASDDASKSARAVLGLAARPKETVPLLRERLRPVKADPKRVAGLLAQLDSDDFGKRESATRELEYMGKYARTHLEKALKDSTSAEVKQRVQRLLKQIEDDNAKPAGPPAIRGGAVSVSNINGMIEIKINGKKLDLTPRIIEKRGPLPAWSRAARAAAVLEHIGTAEAIKVLVALADGEKDALPTRAAAEALKRLKK